MNLIKAVLLLIFADGMRRIYRERQRRERQRLLRAVAILCAIRNQPLASGGQMPGAFADTERG
jgi:hypothetical protein